jgi:hypothetical protein
MDPKYEEKRDTIEELLYGQRFYLDVVATAGDGALEVVLRDSRQEAVAPQVLELLIAKFGRPAPTQGPAAASSVMAEQGQQGPPLPMAVVVPTAPPPSNIAPFVSATPIDPGSILPTSRPQDDQPAATRLSPQSEQPVASSAPTLVPPMPRAPEVASASEPSGPSRDKSRPWGQAQAAPAPAPAPTTSAWTVAGKSSKVKAPPVPGQQQQRSAAAPAQGSQTNGFVFVCSAITFQECVSNNLFGLPRREFQGMVDNIVKEGTPGKQATKLYLFNINGGILNGTFVAVGDPEIDIDPEAWAKSMGRSGKPRPGRPPSSPFPAQIKVRRISKLAPAKIGRNRLPTGVLDPSQVREADGLLAAAQKKSTSGRK